MLNRFVSEHNLIRCSPYFEPRRKSLMKNLLLVTATVIALSSFTTTQADEKSETRTDMAEVQKMASSPITYYDLRAGGPVAKRTGQASSNNKRSVRRQFGWAGGYRLVFSKPQAIISEGFTPLAPVGTWPLRRRSDKIDETKGDELPFIDKEGDTNRNYGIMMTASWCVWCKKMYPEIKSLREQGFRIYVLDVDDYPKLKEKLNRLNPRAPKIGGGAPWFVVRDGGKTTKVFKGYTKADKISPYLKDYKKQLKDEKKPKPKPQPVYNLR